MNVFKTTMLGGLVACLAPLGAHAAYVLDTGTPTGSGMPVSLDSYDYSAVEFSLAAGQTITSIEAYVTAGTDFSGATFTISLYANGSLGGRSPSPIYSGQATYTDDGWTGLTNLDITGLTSGSYWVALEVGSSDSAAGLALPTGVSGGTVAAAHYAYSSNGGVTYATDDSLPIGVQVEVAPVPLPGALLLLGSGVLGLGGLARRRTAAVC